MRTTQGIADLTGDNSNIKIYDDGTDTIIEGEDSLSSLTMGVNQVEVDEDSKVWTFGPNTYVIVELFLVKGNTGPSTGNLEAVVTFYVTGATEDQIIITELSDTLSVD